MVPEEVKAEVLDGLVRSGVAFDAVPDLCELAAKGDPALERLAAGGEREIRIAACYPRAVKWLFHRASAPLPRRPRSDPTTCARRAVKRCSKACSAVRKEAKHDSGRPRSR